MFINKHLIDFMRGGKQYTFLSCFLEFLWTVVGAIISLLSACAIRIVLSGKPFFVFKYVYQPLIIVVVLLFVQFIVYKQKVSSANKGSRIIKTQIRQDLLNKLFELGSAYTTTSRTGEVANTISNKVEWLSNYYTLYLPASSSSIINAVFIITGLYIIDAVTASICLVSCLGMMFCPMLFYNFMKDRGIKEWKAYSDYYSDCLDSIQGITTLKAFNANQRRCIYIDKKGEEFRRAIMSQLRVTMLENGVLEFFLQTGCALSVATATVRAALGVISPDGLIFTLFLTAACFMPMAKLGNAWHMGYRGITASYSISELLTKKATFSLAKANVSINADFKNVEFDGDIEFNDVSFSYDGDFALKDITFTVKNRTMVALVGASGGGKSTIAHLLAGFYPVGSGAIYVGKMNMSKQTVGSIQSMISAVWQDCHIFYGTVYENILLGRPDASRDEVINAAKKANLHDFIETLPMGYDTPLGENGMRFSGGERQRLAIARAILKDAPILIFDEATSSLDRKNELDIQKSFNELSCAKTSLVIAHRLPTIQRANQIIVVGNGKILAAGTHEKLLKSSPEYNSLWGRFLGGQYE